MKTKLIMVLGAILLAVVGFIIYPMMHLKKLKKNKSNYKVSTQFRKEGTIQ